MRAGPVAHLLLAHHASLGAVPAVLDGIVGAARQQLGDLSPAVAPLRMRLHTPRAPRFNIKDRPRNKHSAVPREDSTVPKKAAHVGTGNLGSKKVRGVPEETTKGRGFTLMSSSSSSTLHAERLIDGSSWLCHRSLQHRIGQIRQPSFVHTQHPVCHSYVFIYTRPDL